MSRNDISRSVLWSKASLLDSSTINTDKLKLLRYRRSPVMHILGTFKVSQEFNFYKSPVVTSPNHIFALIAPATYERINRVRLSIEILTDSTEANQSSDKLQSDETVSLFDFVPSRSRRHFKSYGCNAL